MCTLPSLFPLLSFSSLITNHSLTKQTIPQTSVLVESTDALRHTAILSTPPVNFRTQFRTSAGRISSIDPRQGLRRGPTGAELVQRQQAIHYVNQVAGNETQDVIVVQRPT